MAAAGDERSLPLRQSVAGRIANVIILLRGKSGIWGNPISGRRSHPQSDINGIWKRQPATGTAGSSIPGCGAAFTWFATEAGVADIIKRFGKYGSA